MQWGQLKDPAQKNEMDSTCDLIIDSLKEEPIGETDHFIWFITDIGIVALFKREENFETYSSNVEIEACLLYTSPSPRDLSTSRMPSSA